MKLTDRVFIALFFVVQAMWAGSYIVGHFVVRELDPFATVQVRYSIAALTMFPLLLLFFRKQKPNFHERGWWVHTFAVTVTSGVIYQVLFFASLKYISPTTTALIYALNPFFTSFGEVVFLKQRRSTRFYIGFLFAFVGAMWVIFARGGHLDFSHLGIGEGLAFAAALMWSTYTLLARATKKPEWNPLWISGFNYLFTALPR